MEVFQATVEGDTEIVAIFRAAFSASEGPAEGDLIAGLASGLLSTTPAGELLCLLARDNDQLVGAIIFTQLFFADDEYVAYLLSPLAVDPDHQGKGIGLTLVRQGLQALKRRGIDAIVTYGDPDFYGRAGFRPLSVEDVPPPHPLSMPHGWIGVSLKGIAMPAVRGPSRCAPALDDPAYW